LPIPLQRVAQVLSNLRLLLLLDTCEHVIDAAAAFAEAILKAGPTPHVVATSREPLRAEGEWVDALRPLAAPADDAADDQLLRSASAIRRRSTIR
jgi:predicted ATPase